MKVLVNALSAKKGGIVTYTKNLLTSLDEAGIDATVAVPPEFVHPLEQRLMKIDTSGFSPGRRFLWEQIAWRSIVKRHAPDILFSSANFGLLNSPAKQVLLLREGGLFDPSYLANMAPTQGVYNSLNRSIRRRLMLASALRSDQIITPTETMRDLVGLWLPKAKEKCVVNPYGTLNEAFAPTSDRRQWAEDGTIRLLYVSVYYPHKVPYQVCEAIDRINREGLKATGTITMTLKEMSEMSGGSLDLEVVADAERRGIVTLGHHEYGDLPKLYRSHDVFVFPSVSETFGHPMAEAMSSGLPVIVADTQVNREICGDAALYARPYSVEDIARQVNRLHGDLTLRLELSARARERTLNRYGWQDHIDRLLAAFNEITA
ncbi:MAG: glycosyltransferase family 1 protein [Rhodospirillales bacterium]